MQRRFARSRDRATRCKMFITSRTRRVICRKRGVALPCAAVRPLYFERFIDTPYRVGDRRPPRLRKKECAADNGEIMGAEGHIFARRAAQLLVRANETCRVRQWRCVRSVAVRQTIIWPAYYAPSHLITSDEYTLILSRVRRSRAARHARQQVCRRVADARCWRASSARSRAAAE